jgi:hypothetical protein
MAKQLGVTLHIFESFKISGKIALVMTGDDVSITHFVCRWHVFFNGYGYGTPTKFETVFNIVVGSL